MKRYRVAIVGLSDISSGHPGVAPHPSLGSQVPYSHAGAYASNAKVDVVAVCDLLPERLEQFITSWQGIWPEIRCYTDYQQMLHLENLDILSVATPDDRHAEIVIDACNAGLKAIFCEKPMATSMTDAERIIAAAEDNGVVMSIDYTRRWFPETLQAKEAIDKGAIGTLKRIVVSWGGPRALLFRNGSHLVDLICFFAQSDPMEVFAELDPGFENYGPYYAGDGGYDPNSDPGASAYIRFTNGVRAFYNVSQEAVDYREILLIGDKGCLRLGADRVGTEARPELIVASDTQPAMQHSHLPNQLYIRVGIEAAISELLQILEHGGESLSPPREARKSVEIMLAILYSHHVGGRKIHLPLNLDAL